MMKPTIWHDCYESRWQGMITPESMAHPAKYSRDLIERIFDHCLAKGYLQRGDICGDCFGGIATGGITAAYRGLRWFGVELEPKFVALGNANITLHKSKWQQCGLGSATLIQGDSRQFHRLIAEAAGVVTSPPYAESIHAAGNKNWAEQPTDTQAKHGNKGYCGQLQKAGDGYGQTDGQIAALKSGEVSAVITSPPFVQTQGGAKGINVNGYGDGSDKVGERTYQGTGGERDTGNIETLKPGTVDAVVTSPPYNLPMSQEHPGTAGGSRGCSPSEKGAFAVYGNTPGQIETLKPGEVDGVVTSPPWEKNCEGVKKASKFKNPEAFANNGKGHGASPEAKLRSMVADEERSSYGTSDGNIGNDKGETYWEAMHKVYASCFLAIKPGGVIAVVVKNYVKNRKIVPLCDDTAKLLEHIGFTVIERVHAMLVQERRHDDLFGGQTVEKKERKSFFRRLAEKKGSPKIDYEEVIFARKP